MNSWQTLMNSHPEKAKISFMKPDTWDTDLAFNGKVLTQTKGFFEEHTMH